MQEEKEQVDSKEELEKYKTDLEQSKALALAQEEYALEKQNLQAEYEQKIEAHTGFEQRHKQSCLLLLKEFERSRQRKEYDKSK